MIIICVMITIKKLDYLTEIFCSCQLCKMAL